MSKNPKKYKCKAKGCGRTFTRRGPYTIHSQSHVLKNELVVKLIDAPGFVNRADRKLRVFSLPEEENYA